MDFTMARRKHTPDQILAKLRDADVMLADGLAIAEIAKRLEISEQTYHRWRNQYGGMKGPEMKRLKELEKENARLKRVVADLALDNSMLKDLAEGNF
jgi:putative transposase